MEDTDIIREDIMTKIIFRRMCDEQDNALYIEDLDIPHIRQFLKNASKPKQKAFRNAYYACIELLNFEPKGDDVFEILNTI